MKILKVISYLLEYPNQLIADNCDELYSAIESAQELTGSLKAELCAFLSELCEGDLLDAEERYTGLFDRGRSLSLLLFEHVHGESRDRGQAMVDLLADYHEAGFEISVSQLPDYIPIYLEFLSTRDSLAARDGLADIAHILGMLSARLQERGSAYHCLFDTLLHIADVDVGMGDLRKLASGESPDNTPEALDRVWEEQAAFAAGPETTQPSCPMQMNLDPTETRPVTISSRPPAQ